MAQYAAYEPVAGQHLNGELTLGENIADLGGLKLAFRALHKLRDDASPHYVADGLNEEQQFFVAAGQAWCNKAREAEARRLATVDSHSPPKFRINGTLANMPEFAQAFECAPDTAMHPTQTCEVW